MKNKILSLITVVTFFVLTSCAEKAEEKINLYGVQNGDSTKASSTAYLVFFVLAAVVGITLYSFYKKITKK